MTSLVLIAALPVRAEPESALLHPLSVAPNAALTEPTESLQRRFLSIARDQSGYELLLRKEVEVALKTAGAKDYARSDDALAQLAVAAKVKNALFVAFELSARGELVLRGRVVQVTGERVKVAEVTTPRGAGSLLDALSVATQRFFEQLNAPPRKVEPEPVAVVTKPPEPVKPPDPALLPPPPPPPSVETSPPGSPLRTVGFVAGGVGVAAAVAGAVVFATAGTVARDTEGNILASDAARVPGIQAQQGAGVGLLAGGGIVAVAGALMALLAPSAPVTGALVPRVDGAVLVVEGSF